MGLLILSTIFGLLLIDFLLIGIIPPIIGLWPRISSLGDNERIFESSLLDANTNMIGKHVESQVNKRRGYTAAVLTRKHFFLRVNRLNYILKIDVPTIDHVEIGKCFIGRKLKIIFINNGGSYYFELMSTKIDEWISGFKKIQVPVLKGKI